ncbi:hypothetical protein MPH_07081 [Macrophomina phaseolina MS6]|uniref:Uncharacterized protein n=1 Tax=Macrophomina phaseolina (strain MS6) TaxID=1126212 RepID=K2R063_MACPH|nr:hypothetical protein MPH_07081 [Macrophomina phaseolina MS6]
MHVLTSHYSDFFFCRPGMIPEWLLLRHVRMGTAHLLSLFSLHFFAFPIRFDDTKISVRSCTSRSMVMWKYSSGHCGYRCVLWKDKYIASNRSHPYRVPKTILKCTKFELRLEDTYAQPRTKLHKI